MPSIVPILLALIAIWCAAFIFAQALFILVSVAWHLTPLLLGAVALVIIVRKLS